MGKLLAIIGALLFFASLRWAPLADIDKVIFPLAFAVLFLAGLIGMAIGRGMQNAQ